MQGLTLWSWLTLNSQRATSPCLLHAGIKDSPWHQVQNYKTSSSWIYHNTTLGGGVGFVFVLFFRIVFKCKNIPFFCLMCVEVGMGVCTLQGVCGQLVGSKFSHRSPRIKTQVISPGVTRWAFLPPRVTFDNFIKNVASIPRMSCWST